MAGIYVDPYLYDLEYDIREDDLDFYSKHCKALKDAGIDPLILELGCGTGRVSIPLAKQGFKITALDIDQGMLELAKKKAAALDIEFVKADFLDFKLNKKFDAVLMPYNAFQHIHSDENINKFFMNLKRHLNHGARFVMEVMTPLEDDLSRSVDDFSPFDAFYVKKEDDGKLVRTSSEDPEKELLVIEDTVSYSEKDKVAHYKLYYSIDGVELYIREVSLRMFTVDELESILNHYGFRVIELETQSYSTLIAAVNN